jgi:hypothetical protein
VINFLLFLSIESVGLCSDNGNTGGKSLFLITFGSGSGQYSKQTPSNFNFSTTHQQQFESPINDGMFGFVNAVPKRIVWLLFGSINVWHNEVLDHTENDKDGYMYLVNVGESDNQLFSLTVNDLFIGVRYEFSAYVGNVVKSGITGWVSVNPNIRFEVRTATSENQLLAQFSTGGISEDTTMTWSKHGLSFVACTSSVVLLMISNVGGGLGGNDVAIDDIELRVCSTDHSGVCLPG